MNTRSGQKGLHVTWIFAHMCKNKKSKKTNQRHQSASRASVESDAPPTGEDRAHAHQLINFNPVVVLVRLRDATRTHDHCRAYSRRRCLGATPHTAGARANWNRGSVANPMDWSTAGIHPACVSGRWRGDGWVAVYAWRCGRTGSCVACVACGGPWASWAGRKI